jgi:hypothetical protein
LGPLAHPHAGDIGNVFERSRGIASTELPLEAQLAALRDKETAVGVDIDVHVVAFIGHPSLRLRGRCQIQEGENNEQGDRRQSLSRRSQLPLTAPARCAKSQ